MGTVIPLHCRARYTVRRHPHTGRWLLLRLTPHNPWPLVLQDFPNETAARAAATDMQQKDTAA